MKGVKKTKDMQFKDMKKVIDFHEEAQYRAIRQNIMLGEDYRSQALVNYHIILDLKKKIEELEETIRQKNLRLLQIETRERRTGEAYDMELEENIAEMRRLNKLV